MFISNTAIILAVGIWVSLLVGLLVFVMIAFRSQRQLKEQNQIIDTLRTHVQRLATSPVTGEAEASPVSEELEEEVTDIIEPPGTVDTSTADVVCRQEYEDLDILRQALEQEIASQAEALDIAQERIDSLDAALEQAIRQEDQLSEDNQRLERQVKSLSESLSVGDENVMKEIIVNFTEDSREMLNVIETLEAEKSDLEQFVADTQSSEKGTVGTVVGLKRKLSEAKSEIAELREECQRLLSAASKS